MRELNWGLKKKQEKENLDNQEQFHSLPQIHSCFLLIFLIPSLVHSFFFFNCSGFCHTLKWISHGFTCVHPFFYSLSLSSFISTVCVHAQGVSRVWLFVTAWTVAHQIPLSMEFSRPVYPSGLSFPPAGDLPGPGMEPTSPLSPVLAGGLFTTKPLLLLHPPLIHLSLSPHSLSTFLFLPPRISSLLFLYVSALTTKASRQWYPRWSEQGRSQSELRPRTSD